MLPTFAFSPQKLLLVESSLTSKQHKCFQTSPSTLETQAAGSEIG